MESTIVVSIITTIGMIVVAIINKRTNKKVEKISDIKQDIEVMRQENKEDMKKHTLEADKTYLIDFMSDLKAGIAKSEVQKKRAYEIYERYIKNGGNSYVHDEWDDCRKKDLL